MPLAEKLVLALSKALVWHDLENLVGIEGKAADFV